MRLFIAANFGTETRDKIAGIQSVLKRDLQGLDIKWTQIENLHLTLKFLGEVDEGKKETVSQKIRQSTAGVKIIEIDFDKLGVFPKPSLPRVLWLGARKGAEQLEVLAQKIENSLAEIGFEKEERPFSAHLTLGRFRSPGKSGKKISDALEKTLPKKILDVINVVYLMKSNLTPKGPVYEVAEEFRLK